MLDLFTRCLFYWISILVMHSIDSLILMPFRRFKIQKQKKREKNSENIEQKMYFSSSSLNFLSICLHSCLIAGNSGGFFLFLFLLSICFMNNCLLCKVFQCHTLICVCRSSLYALLIVVGIVSFCISYAQTKHSASGQIGIFIVSVRQQIESIE